MVSFQEIELPRTETQQNREEARRTMATHDPSARGSIAGMGVFQSMTDRSV